VWCVPGSVCTCMCVWCVPASVCTCVLTVSPPASVSMALAFHLIVIIIISTFIFRPLLPATRKPALNHHRVTSRCGDINTHTHTHTHTLTLTHTHTHTCVCACTFERLASGRL